METTWSNFRLATRTKLVIKVLAVLLFVIFLYRNILWKANNPLYYVFGHPNIIIVNPLEDRNICQTLIPFSKRQPVDETERSIGDLETLYGHLSLPGGGFRPEWPCIDERTAIIIPYRNRMEHLQKFLSNSLPKLLRQQIVFTIFIIEQAEGTGFNRGMLSNIGFQEANKSADFDCFIFNDVDTLIEDDRNIYRCNTKRVRHMVSSTDEDSYWLPYYTFLGGIIGFTAKQFKRINGYSNQFFLWGAEDDDLFRRIVDERLSIERPPDPMGAVTKLKHAAEKKNKERYAVYHGVKGKSKSDGLNNIQYKVLKHKQYKLFTWITIDLDENAVKKSGKE